MGRPGKTAVKSPAVTMTWNVVWENMGSVFAVVW